MKKRTSRWVASKCFSRCCGDNVTKNMCKCWYNVQNDNVNFITAPVLKLKLSFTESGLEKLPSRATRGLFRLS